MMPPGIPGGARGRAMPSARGRDTSDASGEQEPPLPSALESPLQGSTQAPARARTSVLTAARSSQSSGSNVNLNSRGLPQQNVREAVSTTYRSLSVTSSMLSAQLHRNYETSVRSSIISPRSRRASARPSLSLDKPHQNTPPLGASGSQSYRAWPRSSSFFASSRTSSFWSQTQSSQFAPVFQMPISIRNSRSSTTVEEYLSRVRSVVKQRYYHALVLFCLVCALFLPDLWVLADRTRNTDLDVLLTAIFVLFCMDLLLHVAALSQYRWSFFFWMDMMGALSVLLDVSYFPFFGMEAHQNHGIMLTARPIKLVSRAVRLGRLVKLLRFLPGIRGNALHRGMASSVSWRLTKELSKLICSLLIVLTMILPIFNIKSYPMVDSSIQSWMLILETTWQRNPEQLDEQLSQFERFYADMDYFPFRLELRFPGITQSTWVPTGNFGQPRGKPNREWNISIIRTAHMECYLDFSIPSRWDSSMNMVLIFVVMTLMIIFSTLISHSVYQNVFTPLDRLQERLVSTARRIFTSVKAMVETVKTGTRSEETEYRRTSFLSNAISTDTTDSEVQPSHEMELLREVLDKLTVVTNYIMGGKHGQDQVDDMDDEGKHFVHGTNHKWFWRNTSHMDAKPTYIFTFAEHPSKSMEGISSSLEAQLSIIQSVGLSLELVDSWRMNPLELDKARCQAACLFFLSSHNHGIETEPAALQSFIRDMEGTYNKLPYHSWFHAVDVTHGMYRFLKLFQAELWLTAVERCALLVSAAAHDCGHPGLKNQFLIETKHELAICYNDQSPLENMHCMQLFAILATPQNNIFSSMDKAQFKEARRICVDVILHTDHGFRVVRDLELLFEVNKPVLSELFHLYAMDPREFQASESMGVCPQRDESLGADPRQDFLVGEALECFRREESRELLCRLLLQLSDICNQTKPFRICQIWAYRCLEEFFAQGDAERAAGLPVNSLHDREKVDRNYSQIGFMEFLVAPLALISVKFLPPFLPCAEQMLDNARHWQELWVAESDPSAKERAAVEERLGKLEKKFGEIG